MPKLLITWDPPSDTSDIDSIVLYKKKDAADCEECLDGELIHETSDFTSSGSRHDDQNDEEGEWRYAAFSKNPAGLSPCATNTYTVSTDSAPTVSSSLGDVNAEDTSGSMTIDLSSVFIDSEGDLITKTAESSDTDIASVSVDGDTLTLTFTGGQAGTATITVTGTANGLTVTDQFTVTVTAGAQDQTITFADIDPNTWYIAAGTFELTASATSGLPVVFAVDSSEDPYMTIDGSTVTPDNTTGSTVYRTITITASQAGGTDSNGVQWNPASDVQKTFNLSDPDTDGDGIPDSLDAQPNTTSIPVVIDVFPKFQGHNELSFEFVVNSNISSPIADTSTGQITADSTNFLIELATDASFTSIVKTDNLTVLNGIEVTANNIFKYIHFFDQLVEDTGYWARMTASGGLVGTGTSNAQTPQAGFITNPCDNFNVTTNNNGDIVVTGGVANSAITVTEETTAGSLNGHMRPIALDEEDNIFIGVGENAQGGGKMVFDGGWAKFIGYIPDEFTDPTAGNGWTWQNGWSTTSNNNLGQDAWWEKSQLDNSVQITPHRQGGLKQWTKAHKAHLDAGGSIYDAAAIPGQFAYLYNGIRYIKRADNPTGKILYINDFFKGRDVPNNTCSSSDHWSYYASQKWHSTIKDISEHAGFTFTSLPHSVGCGNAWVHGDNLKNGFNNNGTAVNDKATWDTYLSQFDCIFWVGVERSAYLPSYVIESINDFQTQGGGIFITVDHSFTHGAVNQIVYSYGFQFLGDVDRTSTADEYKINHILNQAQYIPGGSHPLFENISPSASLHAGVSEGKIAYISDIDYPGSLDQDNQNNVNPTAISQTSNYVLDANGSLTITEHDDSTAFGNAGIKLISSASDCGSAIP